jgi:hypothetical protein
VNLLPSQAKQQQQQQQQKTFYFIWSSPPTFLTADAQTAGSAGPATFFSISHIFLGVLFLVFFLSGGVDILHLLRSER